MRVKASEKRTKPPFECQLVVQLEEEREKMFVGVYGPFLSDPPQGISQSEALPQHQICHDQSS